METNPFDQYDQPTAANPFDKFDAPAKPSGAIRKLVADKALGFASGAVGATKAIADAAGAGNKVSNVLADVNTGINDYLSPEAKADQQEQSAIMADAQGKGTWEGIKAGAKAFAVAPVQTAVQGLGSVAPILAGSVLTGGAAPAAAVGAGIGVAMGAGTAKGAIFDDIKKRSLASGMNEVDATAAASKAQEYTGKNTDQIALGGVLGAADALTGVSGAVGRMARGALHKPATQALVNSTERGIVGRAAMGMAGEMPLEAAQGGQEQLAANLSAQRAGFQAGTWDNVASNATLEALASAGPGAAFGALERAPAPPVVPPAPPEVVATPPNLSLNPQTQLTQVQSEEAGDPNVPQTASPDGRAILNSQQEQQRLQREADIAANRAVSSPDDEILASTGYLNRPAPIKPSEAMGLNPAAGPLSSAAVTAVDTGVHDGIKLQEANAADQAAYDQATNAQAQQDAEQDTIDKPITTGPLAEAAMSDEDKRAILFSNKTVADGGIQYEGTRDGDILNGMGKPYPTRFAAQRRARMEGKDWSIAPVFDGFVARRKDAIDGKSTDLPAVAAGADRSRVSEPASGVASGVGATDAAGGAVDAWRAGNQPGREPVSSAAGVDAEAVTNQAQALDTRAQNATKTVATKPETPDDIATREWAANYSKVTGDIQAASDKDIERADGYAAKMITGHQKAAFAGDQAAKDMISSISAEQAGFAQELQRRKSETNKPQALANIAPAATETIAPADQKRAKAIERIAKGSAYFSNGLKAQQFIAQNGLKDTHQAVKTSATRWDVKAKDSQPQEQISGTQTPQAVKTEAQGQEAPAAVEPQWWKDLTGAKRVWTLKASGVKGTATTPWNRLPTDVQIALDEQWGMKKPAESQEQAAPVRNMQTAGAPESVAQYRPSKEASESWNAALGRYALRPYHESGSGQRAAFGEGYMRAFDGEKMGSGTKHIADHVDGYQFYENTSKYDKKKAEWDVQDKAEPPALDAKPAIVVDKAEMRPYRKPDGSVGYEAVPIQAETAAPAKPDTLTDKEKAAKAKMFGALGKLAALAGKNTRMNWTPEEEQQLLPIVIELFDGAMELGSVTFQKAVRYVREFISSNLDQDTADAIPFETLQGAYIHTARKFKDQGATSGKEVMGFDSLAELEKTGKEADTDAKDAPNAARKLDSTSPGSLAGAPTEAIPGPEKVGPTAAGADAGGRADGAGNEAADGSGGNTGRGIPGSAGAVPVSTRGTGKQPRGTKKPGVQGDAGAQSGLGFTDTSGGTGGLIPVNPAPNAAPIPAPAFADFTIEDDFALGEGGPKAKFKGNIEAIKTLQRLDSEGRMAAPTEQRLLAQYVGWGGLAQAFDENNKDWSKEYAELKGLMSEDDYADARVSTRYAHFTSRQVIQDGIYAALKHMGFNGGRALEGGAGVGNFMGLMPTDMRSASRFTAIEREPFSAKIAKHLYPQQNVQEADFTEFVGNDDFYDVAVGNPPFASDPQVDRSGRKHLSGLSLHNYFFAKEVDMLREGGILAQVVTNSFLDASTDTARTYIAEKTKFLGAIRLPNNAFSKNANTEVTTDLIFLQKRPESEWGGKAAKADAKQWLGVGEYRDAEGRTVPLNQYFIDHPDMMLGKFGAYGTMYRGESPALVLKPGQDTSAMLKQAVMKLPGSVYVDRAISNTATMQDALVKTLTQPSVQEGGYFEEDGKLFQRIKDIAGEARGKEITPLTQWTEKTKLGDAGFARIKALAGMRTTVRQLLAAELSNDTKMVELRQTLNAQYDAYAKDHGLINDPGTLRVFDDDPDFPLLASLEHGYTPAIGLAAAKSMGIKMVPSKATKGPIFTQRVIDARQQVAKVETPADALAVSMAERGKLDSAYIGELLGRDSDEVLQDLAGGDSPLLFKDPATGEYALRDAYLSGNVRAKLVQAKQAGMFSNIRALERVQPEDVGSHEIVARVGSPWVPESVYQDFASMLFGEGTNASIKYVKATAGYSAYIKAGSTTANTNTWGVAAYPGTDILSALLNNKPIKVTWKDDTGTHTDVAATENANAKAQDMRDKFQDWLFSDGDRAELLGRAYNDTNNNYVTREFDGEWMTFPGKVPNAIVKFRRHQRNAIARIVQDRTALLDHVVGSGKTYTVIAAAMELRRTGLARKPMIAVPNHLVKQWASDFYKLYPGANILTATKKDFEKSNRRKFLAKIATGDWDAVIIAHSSFGFIKPAPDFEHKFNSKQVANIVKTINEVESGDGDQQQKKRTVKQLEGIKERLENRIKSLRDKPMDSLLDFGELGVDQLFVDEAHMFKNLMFSTKMQNIAGLGDAKGSQRAYDMYVKANQIFAQNGRGQGLVFATGTPVSNSLAEMYHMMRYLMPAQMEEMGFESFDAWANTYASVEQVWMQKASGDGFKAQNRMSNFVNTPELLKVFDQVSDTVTMDDIKKAYSEENSGAEFPLPKLKGGKRSPVSLRKSAGQEAYMATVAARALALEQRKGPPQKGEDNILVIMSDARKAAMDIRLVDPTVTVREPGGRIDRASQEIFARYRQYDAVKGTQIVFSDLGTPLKMARKELAEYQVLKDRMALGSGDEVMQRAALGDEAAQDKVDDAEDAQAELEAKGRDWLGAMQAAERGFSVYDDLKSALMEKGVPENEIAFIHDYNTDEQKAGLFRKMNAGQIRVLVGSTPKLGAGTNVQDRMVALHHLDVPWKPSDVEQREGRIIRQGNTFIPRIVDGKQLGIPGFEVEVLAYVTQDTLDMRMWQVQETKLKMINQLRTRKIGREVENAFEDLELSAGEMQAAATGNIDLLREIQIKGEMKKLEQRKRAFDAQKSDLQNRKKSVAQKLATLPAKIGSSKVMADATDLYKAELASQADAFRGTIDGKEYTNAKEAGAALLAMIDAHVYMQRMEDGKYGGRQLTEAETLLEPKQDPKADDYNPWVKRPVPLSVDFNGEVFKSRDKLTEAFSNARGDKDPISWKFDGQQFNRRTQIDLAIRQNVAEAMSEKEVRQVGSIGPFKVSVEGQTSRNGDFIEVVLSHGGQTISNSGINATGELSSMVSRMAENMAISARQQHDYEKRQLEQAKKESAELDAAVTTGEWPEQGKLEELRQKHKEVLKRLSGAGLKETLDGETLDGSMGPTDTVGNESDVVFSRSTRPTFSRGAQTQATQSVEKLVNAIAANWDNAPEIVVAFDMQDDRIPERVRQEDLKQRSGGAAGTPEGFYYSRKVYLMSSQLATPNDVARVLFHETLGHFGLRGHFGGALKPILQQIVTFRRGDVEAKIKEYGLRSVSNLDRLTAAEEVLAEMAQNTPELGFVKRAIAAIRNWLRTNVPGFSNLKMTDADIVQNFILPARRFVERGNTPTPSGPRGKTTIQPAFSRSMADTLNAAANNVRDVKLPAGYLVADLINAVPGKLNWWHKTIGTQYNLAQRSAPFKRVFDSVQNFINDVSFFATEAADLAPNILPKLESWKDIAKSPLSAADTKAISAPIFEGTLIWARDESGKPVKLEVLEAAAAKLTVDQKSQRLLRGDHLSQGVMKMWRGLEQDQYEALIKSKYDSAMLKAGAVWSNAELKSMFGLTDQQIPLYREFRAATDKSLTNLAISDMLRFGGKDVEPIREQVLAAKNVTGAANTLADYLRSLTDLDPERAAVLTDTADKMIDKGDKAKDLIDRGYAPLSRFGQYTLDVVHNGDRVYFGMFENRFDAAKMNRQMQAEYPGATISQGTVSEQAYKMFAGVSPETLELFGDMLGLEVTGDGAANEAFQTYLKLAKSSRSAMKRLIQRKGIAGFNEDAGRVLAGFVYSNARQTASSLHMGEMTQAATDKDAFGHQGELQDAAAKLVDYIKNPQEEAQAFRGVLFAQYIGGSIASAMVNMTQPLTMTFPWLAQFGGVTSAAKQMAAAVKDATKPKTGDTALDAALKRAEEDGTVSPQEVHQLMQQAQGRGALRSGDGTTAGNAMATASNFQSRIILAWGKPFSLAEQFNRRSTFIAAYRTAVAQGMADPDAFARRAISETQGIYNKGNKPAWARGAVGSILFTFKQYSISYVEMLSRMAKNGPEGKKAALLALGVLFLLSGAGGMPGADDLDDIISGALQSMGYNFDSQSKRQAFFAEVFGEDGARFLETGVSGLPGVPIDVSGRMGLGNLLPGTGLFTKKVDHTRDVAEFAGPGGDLVKRGFDAAGKLITGDVGGAVKSVAPKAAQNWAQAYDMANMGMYRDAKGAKVLDTDGYDAIAKAIGFQPNDVKRSQDAGFEVQRMIGLNRINESEIANRWALGLFEKDPAKVQAARDDLAAWNAANPESPIRIKFSQIAQRVKKMNETKQERIAKTAPREIRAAVRDELAASR